MSATKTALAAISNTDIGTTTEFSHMSSERVNLRLGLITEECEELAEALDEKDIIEVADALGDIIYVVIGFALELGINLEDVVSEIHASNMTKLDKGWQCYPKRRWKNSQIRYLLPSRYR